MLDNKIKCWVISDGNAGTENQCLALTQAMGIEPEIKRATVAPLFRFLGLGMTLLSPSLLGNCGDLLRPPWPDLVIASGRKCVGIALSIRRVSQRQSLIVFVQNPRWGLKYFDLIVAPQHDELRGPNVFTTFGALSRVDETTLQEAKDGFASTFSHLPRPIVSCLIGGSSRHHKFTTEVAASIGKTLSKFAKASGASLLITPSRRTPAESFDALELALGDVSRYIWRGKGENPYIAFLAFSDAILVTADSVSMISDACASGKPVYVFPFDKCKSNKIHKFISYLQQEGSLRCFEGEIETWGYNRLRDTQAAAREIKRNLDLRT